MNPHLVAHFQWDFNLNFIWFHFEFSFHYYFFSEKREHPLHRRPPLSGIAASRFASRPGRRGLNHRNDFLLLLCCSCRIQTLAHKVRRFSLGNNVHRPKVLHQIRPLSTQGCFSPPQPAKVPEGKNTATLWKAPLKILNISHTSTSSLFVNAVIFTVKNDHILYITSQQTFCLSVDAGFFFFS